MTEDQSPENIKLHLIVRPSDQITLHQRGLGLYPYLVVEIRPDEEDEDGVVFDVEAGGGVPAERDEIAGVLTGLADLLKNGDVL